MIKEVNMLTSVEGVYQNGRVELVERPGAILEGARVIVTFIQPGMVDLAEQGIDGVQAEILRSSLGTFVEDWDSPEMSIYDNYDAAKTEL
jgi:hypothetical protein